MERTKNRWLIAASAVGIHLSIGSVYAWSVFSRPVTTQLGWGFKEVQLTFSIAILFLGLSAAFLGHFVEKYGPRKSGILASFFFGAGIAGSGFSIEVQSLPLLYLCYGVLGGIGLGLGYIAPVSTLVKWFPDRRGLATGLAIMGFGFASLISGPVIQRLIVTVGLSHTFYILGMVYFAVMWGSSLYLAPPAAGWMPPGYSTAADAAHAKRLKQDLSQLTANEAVKTRRFYWLWSMLFINVTCGIAVISVASPMGQEIVGITPSQAATMVGLIGLFNGAGRMAWAALSDYIGRANTYTAFFIIQIAAFFFLPRISDFMLFQAVLFLIMTCYGGGFSCIPAFIGDLFGTKQLGAIHGYTLTAWAAAGLTGPLFAAWVRERTGGYSETLTVFLILFVIAFLISLFIRLDIRTLERAGAEREKGLRERRRTTEEHSFPARVDEIGNILRFVTDHAQRAELPPRKVLNMELAVEEAAMNVCNYAYLEEASINLISYAYHDPRRLSIRVCDDPAEFRVELEDRGFPFNPLSVQAPDVRASLEERQPEGLGILLIRTMVDEVSYRRDADKNVLTLIMHKAPAEKSS